MFTNSNALLCFALSSETTQYVCSSMKIQSVLSSNNARVGSRFGNLASSCRPLHRLTSHSSVNNRVNAAAVLSQEELAAEQELRNAITSASAQIYGIPRAEFAKLEQPARYLGNEFGSVHKDWDSSTVRFCLSYPEVYEVGASNLGHIVLYSVLNKERGLLCDRAYLPAPDMKRLLEKYDKPLFGVESRKPLCAFDTLGLSLAYELGGANILEMLSQARIPLTWEERAQGEETKPWNVDQGSRPLIFFGGPTATSNPEPFSMFADFYCLGDGEDALPEIGRCLEGCKARGLTREETLFELATTVKGIYVPRFYDAPAGWGGAVFPIKEGVPPRIQRRIAQPDPFNQVGLVPYVKTVHDRLTVEIRRGCTRGCRFCQPGMLTRPARDVEPERVVAAVEEGLRKTGYNEFSLLSLSCSDYLALPSVGIDIKNRMSDMGETVMLSLPSQRVDAFDDNIANVISTGNAKKGSITFAPEAGTQRMRDIINKGLTNEDLLRGVKLAWDKGWKQVKLYFMIGLPGETDADVMGIAETIAWLQRECRRGRFHIAVNVTISNFTPKPHTPFQWHSVSTSEFIRKQNMLKEAFSKTFQVKYNFTDVRLSAMEDFIARGDRRIGPILRRAWELGHTNMDWWMNPKGAFSAWETAIEEHGMTWKYRQVENGEWNVLESLGDTRFRKQGPNQDGSGGKGRLDRGALADKRLDDPLPWDHVDTGISRAWLKADLQKALEAVTVPDCSLTSICSECGICGDDFGDNVIHQSPPIPEFRGDARPDSTRAQRLRFRYSKSGDAVFLGHLDSMTLWERACRRAAMAVAHDESPYSARPQILPACALPLGATSNTELLELILTEVLDPKEAMARLQQALPPGIRLLSVEEVPVRKLNGAWTEKIQLLMTEIVTMVVVRTPAAVTEAEMRRAVASVLAASDFPVERETGSGKKRTADLRAQLLGLALIPQDTADRDYGTLWEYSSQILDTVARASSGEEAGTPEPESDSGAPAAASAAAPAAASSVHVLRYHSTLDSGNLALPASGVAEMVSRALGLPQSDVEVVHIHRLDIKLREPTKPKPDYTMLRRAVRWDAFAAVAQRFGQGPRAEGIEVRQEWDHPTTAGEVVMAAEPVEPRGAAAAAAAAVGARSDKS